jgi:hypothetical protein
MSHDLLVLSRMNFTFALASSLRSLLSPRNAFPVHSPHCTVHGPDLLSLIVYTRLSLSLSLFLSLSLSFSLSFSLLLAYWPQRAFQLWELHHARHEDAGGRIRRPLPDVRRVLLPALQLCSMAEGIDIGGRIQHE